MDWRSVRFDWNRARAFLVAAEEGSFSAAARALELAQPTIGRQVTALEEELGVALFERVGNALELTAAGLELIDHVRAMADAANRISLTATGQSIALDGSVCISASEGVAAFLLPPIIARLRTTHPGIDVEIVATNSASDLTRREADIAVRNFRPTQPDLVARKLRDANAYLYAAPSYLERIGRPKTLADLSRAELFAFDRSDTFLRGLNALGMTLTERNFRILAPNHLVQWELTKAGAGICAMMEEVGDAEPRVERVLPGVFGPLSVPLWLTTHRELRTSRRIRVVFDLLAEALESPAA